MAELRQADRSAVVSHLYSVEADRSQAMLPTGMITLQFSPDSSKQGRENLLAEYRLEIAQELDFIAHGLSPRLRR